MKIKFLGASGTVTGSAYLLNSDNSHVVVDFGMFQGVPEVEELNRRPLNFNPAQVEALFLTHAHLDHCGRIPILTRHGFRGKIYATEPTIALTEVILRDSAKIARYDHESDLLYNDRDVDKSLSLFEKVSYEQAFSFKDLDIVYKNAGHILGSASIVFENNTQKLVFSGDLGNYPDILVPATDFVDKATTVVMESTYGGRTHPDSDPKEELKQQVLWAQKSSGTLLIPSFAVHKTQVLLYLISQLKENGEVSRDLPVFLDSPMATTATYIYEDRLQMLNKGIKLDFPGLTITTKNSQSKKIARQQGPKVIIAGSGMMTGGRILAHAKRYLSRKNVRLLFVGYQADETLGREILDGETFPEIDETKIKINAEIENIQTLSSHADEPKLLEWLSKINGVNNVILTHGENKSRQKLAEKIRSSLHLNKVCMPNLGDELKF